MSSSSRTHSLLQVSRFFLWIGATSWGGLYAILPRIRQEVTERGWVSDEDFDPIIAAATLVPGPSFVSLAGLVGYRARGAVGSLVAMLSLMLPATVLVASALLFLTTGLDQGQLAPITRMVTVALGGVLLGTAYRIASGARFRIVGLAILAATAVAILQGVPVFATVVAALIAGRLLMGGGKA